MDFLKIVPLVIAFFLFAFISYEAYRNRKDKHHIKVLGLILVSISIPPIIDVVMPQYLVYSGYAAIGMIMVIVFGDYFIYERPRGTI